MGRSWPFKSGQWFVALFFFDEPHAGFPFKKHLDADELEILNRTVNAYLEFAELQALNRKEMTMADWITKLDDFLKLSGRELLNHAGKISADDAKEKAEMEYAQYRLFVDSQPRAIDDALDRARRGYRRPARLAEVVLLLDVDLVLDAQRF